MVSFESRNARKPCGRPGFIRFRSWHVLAPFSRMLRRRVLVSRLGSRGPGGHQKSLRWCSQNVPKRTQALANVRECRASLAVEPGRVTQICRHCLHVALQKCKPSQGSGRSWSRNAELSLLSDSRLVVASRKRQQSHGSGGSWSQNAELSSLLDSRLVVAIGGVLVAKRRTVVTLSTCVWSSRLKGAKRRRDEGGPGHET